MRLGASLEISRQAPESRLRTLDVWTSRKTGERLYDRVLSALAFTTRCFHSSQIRPNDRVPVRKTAGRSVGRAGLKPATDGL